MKCLNIIYGKKLIRIQNQIGNEEKFIRGSFIVSQEIVKKHLEYLQSFQNIIEKNNPDKLASNLHNISIAHLGLGNHKQALDFEFESLNIADNKSNKGISLVNSYFIIGNIQTHKRGGKLN